MANSNPTSPTIYPSSPYLTFDRVAWRALAATTPLPLTASDVAGLRGVGETVDLDEVDTVLRPLSRLLCLHAAAAHQLHQARRVFLQDQSARIPYVIGIAGSVAVGKSTLARLLATLMARWPDTPQVALVPTDGFLLSNAELTRRGLMDRKGFPESYDRPGLLRFLSAIKGGAATAQAPTYSHLRYDIVPEQPTVVARPDILIIEGLNVLQPAPQSQRPSSAEPGGPGSLTVSDFFDFSIYIDAEPAVIRQWYIDRFLTLKRTAFTQPESYFHRYANLDDAQASDLAADIWDRINAPNLQQNIAPTRSRATLILTKAANHTVQQIHLRKV